jgi:hypothetical protein
MDKQGSTMEERLIQSLNQVTLLRITLIAKDL